jgi:predicted RNA-binding protein associated with RNAse of E/G family
MALDLWVAPDGETQVLDEDEFAALPLTSSERDVARQALAELQEMVARGAAPFDRGAGGG